MSKGIALTWNAKCIDFPSSQNTMPWQHFFLWSHTCGNFKLSGSISQSLRNGDLDLTQHPAMIGETVSEKNK